MKKINIAFIICILITSISCKKNDSKSRDEIIKDSIEHAKLKEEVLDNNKDLENKLEKESLVAYNDLMFLMSIDEVRNIEKYKNNSMESEGENAFYTELRLNPELIPVDNIEKFTAIFYQDKLNIIRIVSRQFTPKAYETEIPKIIQGLKNIIGKARIGNYKEYGIPKIFEFYEGKFMTVYMWEFNEKTVEIMVGEVLKGDKFQVVCEISNYLAQTNLKEAE